MKNFYAIARFRMATPADTVDGGVIIPAGIAAPVLARRKLSKKFPHLRRRLLDPQIYLANLSASLCAETCTNLISYGWFGEASIDQYDSQKLTQAQWKASVIGDVLKKWKGKLPSADVDIDNSITTCLALQAAMECEMLILPAPLISSTKDISTSLQWLDRGLAATQKLKLTSPALATIAISDHCLRAFEAWSNPIIDSILDQVTARAPYGAYVVLEQASEDGYYFNHPNTVSSLLRLVDGLKAGGLKHVHVAFAGVAGLLSLIAGADTWSAGWYRSQRRLRLRDFEQKEGRAYPAYYSHALAAELHLDADLDATITGGFLPKLGDNTPASEGLLRALSTGKRVSSVPEWQYRQSNITRATEHFLHAMTRETRKLSSMTQDQQIKYGRDWLDGATRLAAEISRIGTEFNARTSLIHQLTWQQAFDEYCSNAQS
ncbi:hypothetical protein [Pyxidicoccus caerfyrddinensis]|uniref:hypothetical protein n=1 Tax=Pyxidicoccus caerfyrddinensis TaxID=2709663 RepID=UPI0013DB7605|nr:hypothetical protein [Pyxidicoccus caerfyrddinensis]